MTPARLPKAPGVHLSEDERRRRKRERILIVVILVVMTVLTYAETRIIHFGGAIPVSNAVLMFIVININLILLILLIFLVFRNLVKLFYERRHKVMGANLRTRLVVAFIVLTLLPTTILFVFSINFITSSIQFWFNQPVEQALENALQVGQGFYRHAEATNRFFLERVAYQIETKEYLKPDRRKLLTNYLQVVQRAFIAHAVEVYDAKARRLEAAVAESPGDGTIDLLSLEEMKSRTAPGGVHTVNHRSPVGELVRTVATVPFGVPWDKAQAYVVMTQLVGPDLAAQMASISRGYAEYQQIKLLKRPIRITYYISLSIVALLVVFCAIWFALHFSKTITIPIRQLADGTRRVAEGDLGFVLERAADDEIGRLVDDFNRMTEDLRRSREQLEQSARALGERNVEIEARRQYMEILLRNVSAGVVSVSSDGRITTINPSAEEMLHLSAADILDRSFRRVLQGELLDMALRVMDQLRQEPEETVRVPLTVTVAGQPRSLLVHASALTDDLGRNMGAVCVLDDLTELEKAQRMAAWREVARRIAHEVKNPLTPIALSAQRLKRRYAARLNEPVFEECVRMIIDHVDLIRNLVNAFSTFARFPTAVPEPCDLLPIIEETVALYREGHERVKFFIETLTSIPVLNLDRQQIKQAMINLVDNAVTAVRQEGTITIRLRHDPETHQVEITVADDGRGIALKDRTRLFEPDFSTKKSGMGLGLTIVQTIVSDHGGSIRAEHNQPRGAKFIIELPALGG